MYDTAGRLVRFLQNPRIYDGDGRQVKTSTFDGFSDGSAPVYYIRSIVLGGSIVSEIGLPGADMTHPSNHIFLGTTELATRFSEYDWNSHTWKELVGWHHRDQLTGSEGASGRSYLASSSSYSYGAMNELDTMGVNANLQDPYFDPPTQTDTSYASVAPPSELGNGELSECWLDNIRMNCEIAQDFVNSGAAVPCPDNRCGPQPAPGGVGWTVFNGSGIWYSDGIESGRVDFTDLIVVPILDGLMTELRQPKKPKKPGMSPGATSSSLIPS